MAAAAKLTQHVRALTWLDDSAPLGSGFGLTTSAAISVTCASRRYGCTLAKGPIWRSRPSSRLARSTASASAGVARRRKPDNPRFGSSNSFCIASRVTGQDSGAHGRQPWHLDVASAPSGASGPCPGWSTAMLLPWPALRGAGGLRVLAWAAQTASAEHTHAICRRTLVEDAALTIQEAGGILSLGLQQRRALLGSPARRSILLAQATGNGAGLPLTPPCQA